MTTNTHTTQAAAQRCADLANAVDGSCFVAADFSEPASAGICLAFRRYVERIDARDREVLALLLAMNGCVETDKARVLTAIDKLRADLLPDAKPTLLEEFLAQISEHHKDWTYATVFKDGAAAFADWIAKRGVEVKP